MAWGLLGQHMNQSLNRFASTLQTGRVKWTADFCSPFKRAH